MRWYLSEVPLAGLAAVSVVRFTAKLMNLIVFTEDRNLKIEAGIRRLICIRFMAFELAEKVHFRRPDLKGHGLKSLRKIATSG
jgi:hypothetical protein